LLVLLLRDGGDAEVERLADLDLVLRALVLEAALLVLGRAHRELTLGDKHHLHADRVGERLGRRALLPFGGVSLASKRQDRGDTGGGQQRRRQGAEQAGHGADSLLGADGPAARAVGAGGQPSIGGGGGECGQENNPADRSTPTGGAGAGRRPGPG